ncbi:hypothetical protein [Dyadobacter sp. CY356]|uniref:hypothetical protein n=1 Tax=Dyadobacter sp. CY356 TaxID=2906442 RepID=UPI001F1FD433|nr:hypothetical protein [Dyadobacter sp. CY356]MCF0056146.1 hypothetical protein [Dyadobacter sp. CY356]
MNRLINLVAVFVILFSLGSCGSKDNDDSVKPTEKSKILVNYPWRMSSVTDLNGKAIADNLLSADTKAIGTYMDIQFLSNNVTKALEQKTSQVINGGTWYLIDNDATLDIAVTGFSGKFGVVELTNSKLRLKSTMPVDGVDTETIMVFEPVIK